MLFIQSKGEDFLLVQVYANVIIFGDELCEEFSNLISKEFKISPIRELSFFLGYQIRQFKEDILINQPNYIEELLKKFIMSSCKLDKDQSGKIVFKKMH